jgi:hypothetical protein
LKLKMVCVADSAVTDTAREGGMARGLFRSVMPLALFLILTGQAVGQLDFEREPINYSHSAPTDPVSRLAKDVSSGKRTLAWEDGHGYLQAVLQALEISPTSQTLVFRRPVCRSAAFLRRRRVPCTSTTTFTWAGFRMRT